MILILSMKVRGTMELRLGATKMDATYISSQIFYINQDKFSSKLYVILAYLVQYIPGIVSYRPN